ALTLAAHAEDITLDLTTATDASSIAVDYETEGKSVWNGHTKDVWTLTYSEADSASMLLANDGKFMFEHNAIADYDSWGGFTISKNAADTLNQFACAAKGGVKGVGSPFIVAYYQAYLGALTLTFDDFYYPKEIYVCQDMVTLLSLQNGDDIAKKFTAKDTLALHISGLDENDANTDTVTHYLAVDSVFNQAWTKIDLSSIGYCYALEFSMTSTDTGAYGMNTPAYFALDALTVSTDSPTTSLRQTNAEQPKATKRLINGQLYIEQNNRLYTLTGVAL
ncbi:MAG: DUF4465 domain-containing protein, partial [Bacteroidales bacterium]|nr:DUF4465 domain-containing protein [Bacteroidales bacterium]